MTLLHIAKSLFGVQCDKWNGGNHAEIIMVIADAMCLYGHKPSTATMLGCIVWYQVSSYEVWANWTHLPLDKMAAILYTSFQMYFREKMFCILIKFSFKFVPTGQMDNNPAMIQIMAWCRISDQS